MINNKAEFGYWTVDGSPDFAWMPPELVPMAGCESSIPIRLQVGTTVWGERHINHRHGAWLAQQKVSAAQMVHLKLGQPGNVYATEENSKLKVNITLSPTALLVLRYFEWPQPFFTVVTVYFKGNSKLDGDHLGIYRPTANAVRAARPVFAPPQDPIVPKVAYKRRRAA